MAYIIIDQDRRWVPEKKTQLVARLVDWGILKVKGKPIRTVSQPQLFRICCAETARRTRRRNKIHQTERCQLRLF